VSVGHDREPYMQKLIEMPFSVRNRRGQDGVSNFRHKKGHFVGMQVTSTKRQRPISPDVAGPVCTIVSRRQRRQSYRVGSDIGSSGVKWALRLNSITRARPDPRGPARTRTDFVGDTHGPNGVSRRPGPQKSPCGSGRVRVLEFSY